MSDMDDREVTHEELEAFLAPTREAARDVRILKWIISALVALPSIYGLAFIFLEEAWPWFVPTPTVVFPIFFVAIIAAPVFFLRRNQQRLIDITRRGGLLTRRPRRGDESSG